MVSQIQQHVKQRKGFPSLGEEVFVGIQIVAYRLMAPWAATLKETAGLTPVQYNVLRILRGAGDEGLWAGEVGNRLITRSPDVTRLVDRLVVRGLVRRSSDPGDRRAVRIHITGEGLEKLAMLDELAHPQLARTMDAIGPERLLALRDLIEATLEAMESS